LPQHGGPWTAADQQRKQSGETSADGVAAYPDGNAAAMNSVALLTQVRALGVSVRISGDNIALRPIAAVPNSLLTALKTAKPELLALLRASESAAEPQPTRVRPPSWPDLQDEPRTGDRGNCCHGGTWWTESSGNRQGWPCDTGHPADHLPPATRAAGPHMTAHRQ
jgi:hypothetical protein